MKHLRLLILILLSLGVASLAVAQSPPEPAAAPPSQPAAKNALFEECSNCHEDAVSHVQKTMHGKLANSCADCHGDVTAHAASGDPADVKSLKSLSPKEASQTCLNCHEKGRQANWHGGMHDRRGVGCTSCHSVHDFKSEKAQLKTVRAQETCFSCHPNVRSQGMRTSHHPVREGKMDCSSCHNPHDATKPKMLLAESINEQCYSCHTEKRGPFLWEHAPVREKCTTCHTPHGSNHDKLLVAKQPYLCQRCHANTRHPGTLYDARNAVAGANPSNRLIEHGCRNCHQNIHGSNHPSGPYLGR